MLGLIVPRDVMSPAIDKDDALTAAIGGISRIVDHISNLAPIDRSTAVVIAEQSYLESARKLGYDEFEAHLWAEIVVNRLKMDLEQADICSVQYPSGQSDQPI